MLLVPPQTDLAQEILDHLLQVVSRTSAEHEPFSHIYFENLFPAELYAAMMAAMPDPSHYQAIHATKHVRDDGVCTRDILPLDGEHLSAFPERQRALWQSVAGALAAPELKVALFRKLAPDLSLRFGIPQEQVESIVTYSKPSLMRDLEGYEIPPHPDGRAKVVTMQLYLPQDRSQLDLGTALYQRRFTSLRGLVSWHGRFAKMKQFLFQPNSGYAFAVSNSLRRKSWHGRERLRPGAGVRNSILNLYFASDERSY